MSGLNEFHFGVVVGIDLYPGKGMRNLNSARADAKAFAEWLRDPNGGHLPKENVQLILEEGPFDDADKAQPTRDAVNKAFKYVHSRAREIFPKNPTKWNSSRLYVYFSGHGLAPEPSEVAVLMANATDEEPHNVACGLYLTYYEKCQDFHEIVIFTDCCRSAKKEAPRMGPPFYTKEQNYGSVVSALCYATRYKGLAYEPEPNPTSSQPETDEDVTEVDESSRGYYTQALLAGLRGEAIDPESPGEINSTSLQNYLFARVPALTKGKRFPQFPQMKGDPADKIIFREGAKRAEYLVTITFPSEFRGKVDLRDGRLRQIDTFDYAGTPWQKRLPDGLYEVRKQDQTSQVGFREDGMFRVLGGDTNVEL